VQKAMVIVGQVTMAQLLTRHRRYAQGSAAGGGAL